MLPHEVLIYISLITSQLEAFIALLILLSIASLPPFPFSYWRICPHFEERHSLSCQPLICPGVGVHPKEEAG